MGSTLPIVLCRTKEMGAFEEEEEGRAQKGDSDKVHLSRFARPREQSRKLTIVTCPSQKIEAADAVDMAVAKGTLGRM